MGKFDVIIASLPDRERVVAEICYDNELWIELSQETDELIVQCYPSQKNAYWEFPLNEALEVLEQAKLRLLEGKFPKNWSLE